jgi:hypothetical protein
MNSTERLNLITLTNLTDPVNPPPSPISRQFRSLARQFLPLPTVAF